MKVYLNGNQWCHKRYQRACRPLAIHADFFWKEYSWKLLGGYVCRQGLVLDFAKEVPIQQILEFDDKWKKKRTFPKGAAAEYDVVSEEERLWMEYENPLESQMNLKAWVNNRQVSQMEGRGYCYNPVENMLFSEATNEVEDGAKAASEVEDEAEAANEVEEGAKAASEVECEAEAASEVEAAYEAKAANEVEDGAEAAYEAKAYPVDGEVQELMTYYQLDRECGWCFWRMSLSWEFKRIPKRLHLKLELKPDSYNLPCDTVFTTHNGQAEQRVTFRHPLEHTQHVLVVKEVRAEEVAEKEFPHSEEYVFPRQLQYLQYYMENPEDEDRFRVRDTVQGDAPICREDTKNGAVSVFLVGRVCGKKEQEETVTVPDTEGRRKQYRLLNQVSRLCFLPIEQTTWRIDAVVNRGACRTLEFSEVGVQNDLPR